MMALKIVLPLVVLVCNLIALGCFGFISISLLKNSR